MPDHSVVVLAKQVPELSQSSSLAEVAYIHDRAEFNWKVKLEVEVEQSSQLASPSHLTPHEEDPGAN